MFNLNTRGPYFLDKKIFIVLSFALIIFLNLLTPAVAISATFGYTSIAANPDAGDSNNLAAWKFTTSASQFGTVSSMSVYIPAPVSSSPNNQFQLDFFMTVFNRPHTPIMHF